MKRYLQAAVRSHVGRVRSNNEDNYYLCGHWRQDVSANESACWLTADDHCFLAAAADGMGGEASGELASLFAVESLSPCPFDEIHDAAAASIQQANRRICGEIRKNGGKRMGSTLAALYIDDGRAVSVNIGDSRCYLFRGSTLTQLSTDHNSVQQLIALGALTPEEAARHPSRHKLTQHLGIFEEELVLEPAFSEPILLQPNDLFLLCSDGLTDMLPEEVFIERLAQGGDVRELADSLVWMALEKGGRDNITVLLIRVQPKPASAVERVQALFQKKPR